MEQESANLTTRNSLQPYLGAISSPALELSKSGSDLLTSAIFETMRQEHIIAYPSLSLIRAKAGAVVAELHVLRILKETLRFVNHQLTEEDLVAYAKKFCVQFYWLRLEDLCRLINQGIAGNYGRTFGRWNYQTLAEWASAYDKERMEEIEQARHLENSMRKRSDELISPELLARLPNLPKPFAQAKSLLKPTQTRSSDFFQGILKHFDLLHRKYGIMDVGSIRMIRRYGKVMDIHQFAQYKLKQRERLSKRKAV